MTIGGWQWFVDVARGRRGLPVWLQVAFVPLALLIVLDVAARRGWAWGAVAALTYGYIAIANSVARNRLREWSTRRSERDNYLLGVLLCAALLFVALPPLESLSTAVCAAVALAGGVIVGAASVLRRRLAS